MAAQIILNAQKRQVFGKKVKKLRLKDLIPANVFGKDLESVAITIDLLDLKKTYKQAGETSVINLSIEGEKDSRPVLISNIQTSPIVKQVLHVDFRQVDLTQKITANVPVELIGESDAVAQGAILVTLKNEIEVEALPTDIPDKIELNISILKNIGDTITAANIKLDQSKVEVKLDSSEILVQLQEPSKEPVPEVAAEVTTTEAGAEAAEKTAKPEAEKKSNA